MNKKLLLTSLIVLAGVLVMPVISLAQSADPTNVLPAKTVKTARQFSGNLFAGQVLIGTVSQVADKIITVTQKNGTEADIITTEVTKFNKGGRKINLISIAVGDSVVALGASSIDGTFLAKAIVARSKVLKELKKVPFYGVVNEVGAKSFTLRSLANDTVTEILVNTQTVIKRLNKKVALSTMVPGQRAVVISLMEDDGTYTGKMVVLLNDALGASNSKVLQSTPSTSPQP